MNDQTRLSGAGKLTVIGLIVAATGIGALVPLGVAPLAAGVGVLFLLGAAGLVLLGVRWMPTAAAGLALLGLVGGVVAPNSLADRLADPAERGVFVATLLQLLGLSIAVVVGIIATAQNYRPRTPAQSPTERS